MFGMHFPMFAPEWDEAAAKKDVIRTATATAEVAACITGSGVCIVAGESA
jgi:hypothetical protein